MARCGMIGMVGDCRLVVVEGIRRRDSADGVYRTRLTLHDRIVLAFNGVLNGRYLSVSTIPVRNTSAPHILGAKMPGLGGLRVGSLVLARVQLEQELGGAVVHASFPRQVDWLTVEEAWGDEVVLKAFWGEVLLWKKSFGWKGRGIEKEEMECLCR